MNGSRVNRPGQQTATWVQGCSPGCSGCFNPRTHDLRDPSTLWAASVNDLILNRGCNSRKPDRCGPAFCGRPISASQERSPVR